MVIKIVPALFAGNWVMMTPPRAWTTSCRTGIRIDLCFYLNRGSRVFYLFGLLPFFSQAYVADVLEVANSSRWCIYLFNEVLFESRNGILLVDPSAGLLLDLLAEVRVLTFQLAIWMMNWYSSSGWLTLLSNLSIPVFPVAWRGVWEVSGSVFKGYGVELDGWIALPINKRLSARSVD